ncbi:hypothetical protein KC909_04595 [Candidatus Dojkabacteria bacterium]|uniref:Carbonic anhydrase n=1 Tax=Candidatus Dojkabacteria bacterium TaxID=2099670 RepID=A0A955RJ57_9BACT|nr:hypothetical protein [Candidatus Dojkabacteria bacterium]
MHKAKASVISCMDFRFHDKIQAFLQYKDYLGKCDEIAVAGGTRDFITPVEDADGEYIWKQLELSIKLHDPEEIIFIDHQDCGGYGQDDTIPLGLSKKEDLEMHKKFCTKLRKVLMQKHPDKKFTFLYAPLRGDIVECE